MDSDTFNYLNSKLKSIQDLENLDDLLSKSNTEISDLEQEIKLAENTCYHNIENLFSDDSYIVSNEGSELLVWILSELQANSQILDNYETLKPSLVTLQNALQEKPLLTDISFYFVVIRDAQELKEKIISNFDQNKNIEGFHKYADFLIIYEKIDKQKNISNKENLLKCLFSINTNICNSISLNLTSKFKQVLDKMGWPKPVSKQDYLDSFKLTFIDCINFHLLSSKFTHNDSDPLLPFAILCNPLELHFRFHFEGNKETNRLDKPEWIFSHVNQVIETHASFIQSYVQDCLSIFPNNLDALSEFIYAYIPIVCKKMQSLLEAVKDDKTLFKHAIYEAIKFDQVLHERFNYNPHYKVKVGILESIFTDSDLFQLWFNMERDFTIDRFAEIMSADDAFALDMETANQYEIKPTKSAIRIKDLIEATMEKYKYLNSLDHRLYFLLDIQVYILENYLLKLASSFSSLEGLSLSIARAVSGVNIDEHQNLSGVPAVDRLLRVYGSTSYLKDFLSSWNDSLFFIRVWSDLLHYSDQKIQTLEQNEDKNNIKITHNEIFGPQRETIIERSIIKFEVNYDTSEKRKCYDKSIFSVLIADYMKVNRRSRLAIGKFFSKEAQKLFKAYFRKTDWPKMYLDSNQELTYSVELTDALHQIKELSSFLHSAVSEFIYNEILNEFIIELQEKLWYHIILANTFNAQGVKQLLCDLNAISRAFGRDVQSCFVKILDVCTLLELPSSNDGPCLQNFKRSLSSGVPAIEVFSSFKFKELTANEASLLLDRRNG